VYVTHFFPKSLLWYRIEINWKYSESLIFHIRVMLSKSFCFTSRRSVFLFLVSAGKRQLGFFFCRRSPESTGNSYRLSNSERICVSLQTGPSFSSSQYLMSYDPWDFPPSKLIAVLLMFPNILNDLLFEHALRPISHAKNKIKHKYKT